MSETIQGAEAPVEVVQAPTPITPNDNPQPIDPAGKPEQVEAEKPEPEKAEQEAAKEEKKPDWQNRRIDELYRKQQEEIRARNLAEAQVKELKEKLSQFEQPQPNQPQAPQPGTPQFEALIKAEAERRLEAQRQEESVQKANQRRQSVVAQGDAEYGKEEFAQHADTLARMGVLLNGELVETILESDKAHNLIAHLATNPGDADRLLGMTPRQQAKEIGRLEDRLSQPKETKQVSKAPAPMKPVSGGAKREWTIYDPDIPQDVYEKLRGYRQ